MTDFRTMNTFWIQIFIGAVVILHSCSCEKRLIEYAAPWQPVAIPAAAAPQLISIGNFDATNKAQIAQIAHHNAQILRQIKGLHPPVTQYLNPFPVFPSPNSKHVVMSASALPSSQNNHLVFPSAGSIQQSPLGKPSIDKYPTTQNLISSSSNVAQTVMPQTVMKYGGKPSYGKPEYSQLKFYNGVTSSSKVPSVFLNSASSSVPSFQQMFSTTSRTTTVPLLRDMTLSSPSSIYKSTQVPPKFNPMTSLSGGSRPAQSNQIPGQIISSYTHFGPAAPQIIRSEPKPRIRANFLTSPFDHYAFGNPYSGHLTPGGHFVAKNNYPNSLYFPHNSLGSYQLTNTFVSVPQKPNSQPYISNIQQQQQQQHPHPPLPESQPSYLPQLPTVPPSVLSPFFQVNSGKQQDVVSTATPSHHDHVHHEHTHHGNFQLLNDEYTINLVPPPPYKDSTRFRPRPIPSTTPTAPTSSHLTTNSTPAGPPVRDFFEDEDRKAMDILQKYNIPAISPLQDANRFSYNSGSFSSPSTTTQSTPFKTAEFNSFPSFKRRPSTTPFLPTSDSLNNAITHSFFTIEDAITISPHLHYRRPVKPTNTNEIEASIRRPSNDIYTETASIDTFGDFDREPESTEEPVTIPPPPSSSSTRPRQKLRRKRPRPTTESTSTYETDHNQVKPEIEETINEGVTDMPKNHKEYSVTTKDRGNFNLQFSREPTTITPEPPREVSTVGYRFNNRARNRTRGTANIESSSSTPIPLRKRPYNSENRRPNNRFEDNKVPRRPQAERSTRLPFEESEQTTVSQRENFNRPSRRPFTTQQAIPTTLQDGNEAQATEDDDFFAELRPTNRVRNANPSTISTTAFFAPTIDNAIVDTTQGRPEENSILSTRLSIANEADISTNIPDSSDSDDEVKTEEPEIVKDVNEDITPPASSISTSTSTSSTSTAPEKVDSSKEAMITSDGPVYLRDESKLEMSNFRNRQRMRNKEKILEAVAAATSSQTKSVAKDRGQNFVFHNEVNDIDEPTSTEKDSRLRVRLPVYKNGNKLATDDLQLGNSTKPNRLNGMNKFDPKNRPRFSIKEYRQRMSSTTTATPDSSATNNLVSTTASYTRLRFPTRQRILPSDLKNKSQESNKIETEKPNIVYPERPTNEPTSIPSSTEPSLPETTRKRFVPKDRYSSRLKTTTETTPESQTITSTTIVTLSTPKSPLRRTNSTRRDSILNRTRLSTSTTESTQLENNVSRTPIVRNNTIPLRRPQVPNLRQRIQNQKKKETTASPITTIDDSLNDLVVESSSEEKVKLSSNEIVPSSTEETKPTTETRQTAIMKIAKDDHSYRPYKEKTTTEKPNIDSAKDSENDLNDSPSEQSERVAELTIFGSNQFNSVNTGAASRRIPGYFTLATEDPILPIEAFFPQVKRSK